MFESYVILDTTKTTSLDSNINKEFESYVILDTTKTGIPSVDVTMGLRVMLF